MNIQIKGMGHFLPETVLSNKDLEKIVDTSEEWIIDRTGIRERRIADPKANTSDLAIEASRVALERAGIKAEELDLIVVGTATPDMVFPSTACLVQDALGARNAAAFDLSAGCTGFIYALVVAEKFLNSTGCNNALVIGAEVLSRITDYSDRNTCVLFGDGAGAAVLGKGNSDAGIICSFLGADGSGGPFLQVPAGGCALPASEDTVKSRLHFIRMNGNEIFRFATRITMEASDRLLSMAKMTYDDIDFFVPHQSNLRIIKTAQKRMNLPLEKTLINVDKFGNMSAACIPVALSMAEEEGRIKPGHIVLMVSFGAGLTYGGALIRWGRD
ncbi:MAG: beta-ketoacyl-ACP synthase III [Syntrophomonadaceae bacterium]|jgi:3-oxoacyl-[acyl-carrier-protein] synthase-3